MRISVDGSIGAGKSSVIASLTKDGVDTHVEPVEDWGELLKLMYDDPVRWSTAFNINALLSFAEMMPGQNKTYSVYERSPLSCMHIFSALQRDLGYMTAAETKLVERTFKQVAWVPDAIIYLRTTPDVAFVRMQSRGRAAEAELKLQYITDVHNKYDEFMAAVSILYPGVVVTVIDANQSVDTVERAVKECIAATLAKIGPIM